MTIEDAFRGEFSLSILSHRNRNDKGISDISVGELTWTLRHVLRTVRFDHLALRFDADVMRMGIRLNNWLGEVIHRWHNYHNVTTFTDAIVLLQMARKLSCNWTAVDSKKIIDSLKWRDASKLSYLIVTRFFIRFPKSEKPRLIGGRACWWWSCRCSSSNDLVIGEFGSDDCLSTKIGLGCG